jgi:hypothetical protein
MTPKIETPKGAVVIGKNGKAELKFNPNFAPKWTRRYALAQKFVDSEILRLSEPFTPMQTGSLIKSGQLGTDVGSGEVSWIAPYSRRQYYAARKPGSETGALRGPFWFERMRQVHGERIINGAKRIAGRA